jgi:hypothetical protein
MPSCATAEIRDRRQVSVRILRHTPGSRPGHRHDFRRDDLCSLLAALRAAHSLAGQGICYRETRPSFLQAGHLTNCGTSSSNHERPHAQRILYRCCTVTVHHSSSWTSIPLAVAVSGSATLGSTRGSCGKVPGSVVRSFTTKVHHCCERLARAGGRIFDPLCDSFNGAIPASVSASRRGWFDSGLWGPDPLKIGVSPLAPPRTSLQEPRASELLGVTRPTLYDLLGKHSSDAAQFGKHGPRTVEDSLTLPPPADATQGG